MADLRIFTDEYEWYVARDLTRALAMQRRLIGENPGVLSAWWELAPDADLRVWIDPKTGEVGELGCGVLAVGEARVWIEAYGPGFLCAAEV